MRKYDMERDQKYDTALSHLQPERSFTGCLKDRSAEGSVSALIQCRTGSRYHRRGPRPPRTRPGE
jgi:hypothetical protein